MNFRKRSTETFSPHRSSRLSPEQKPPLSHKVWLWLIIVLVSGAMLFRSATYFLQRRESFSTTHLLFTSPHQDGEPFRQLTVLIISQQKGYVIALPDQRQVQTLGKLGQYPASSLPELFRREKPHSRYLPVTVAYELGYPLQEQVSLSKPVNTDKNLSDSLTLSSLLRAESSLDLLERFFLWEKLREVQIVSVPYSEIISPNGELMALEKETLSRSLIAFPALLSRKVEVALLNGTENKGLASRFSQLAEVAGFRVIAVEKASPETMELTQQKSMLFISDQVDSEVVQDSVALFPTEVEVKQDAAFVQKFRAHLVFVIGEEFLQ